MRGLFLYYLNISKKKILVLLAVSILVIMVSFMESAHELLIIYMNILPMILLSFNREDIKGKMIFEKIIPVRQEDVVLVKYIFLIGSFILVLALSFIYIKIIKLGFFIGSKANTDELLSFMLGFWWLSLSTSIALLIDSYMDKSRLKKYLVFLVPLLQSIILIKDVNWNDLLYSISSSTTRGDLLVLIITSALFLIISYPVSIKLQKNTYL